VRGEVVIERPDGTRRNILPYPEPLFDSSGQLLGAVNMLFDITDRKRAEEAVRDREERLQAILNTAMDAIITIDQHGIIQSVNSATERILATQPRRWSVRM
jgi:PAS domain-containing protein